MDAIDTFQSHAAECTNLNGRISEKFLFSDFCLCFKENTLKFKWTSSATKKTCDFIYIASVDYPENCFLHQQWEESIAQDFHVCCPLQDILTSIGLELQRQELDAIETGATTLPVLRTNVFQLSADQEELTASKLSKETEVDEEEVALTVVDNMDMNEENSDLEYTDGESLCSDYDEDDFDFDPVEFYDEMNKPKASSDLDLMHPLLRQDILTFRDIYGDSSLKKRASAAPWTEKVYAEITFRLLEALGEIDCDIHVPLHNMNLAPQLANAWKVDLDSPLIVRLNLNYHSYLDFPDPPKVDVFQPNRKDCGVAVQMKNILTLFLKDVWNKTDNQVLRSNLRRSGSAPTNLSGSAGVTTAVAALDDDGDDDSNDGYKELKHLLEMGFQEKEARSALILTNNNLMEASDLLAASAVDSDQVEEVEKKSTKFRRAAWAKALPRTSAKPDSKQSNGKLAAKRAQSYSKSSTCKKLEPSARSLSTSQTEPNLSDTSGNHWAFQAPTVAGVKIAPPLDDGFLVMLYKYTRQRMLSLNDFCVVCDCTHVFQTNGAMLMPSVCSRELCLFAYQTLGVMANATAEIATGAEAKMFTFPSTDQNFICMKADKIKYLSESYVQSQVDADGEKKMLEVYCEEPGDPCVTVHITQHPRVVDLLITLAKAACFSTRQATILTPFPSIVDPSCPGVLALSDKKKDFKKVEQLLGNLPSMSTLTSSSVNNLHKTLDKDDPLLYPLLSWIIYSNRSHIVKLNPEKQLKCMATPHQFLLLSSAPAQEKEFQKLKAKYGSCFAFHGSSIENWHAIIRRGLIVATGTKFQVHGAAHGKGIYLSPLSTYSFTYSRMGYHCHDLTYQNAKKKAEKGDKRFLSSQNLNCIALCEVIKSPSLSVKTKDIWLVTEKSHVCTRFFFVYEDGQVGNSAIDMTHDKYKKMVEDALSGCFMAVVPDSPRQDEDEDQ